MKRLFSLVGRTRFELVTNGLKARYAVSAYGAFPLCAPCTGGNDGQKSRQFCQYSPTFSPTQKSAPSHEGPGARSNKIAARL